MTLPTYTFLPWLRQGLANRITSADPGSAPRAVVEVKLSLEGTGGPKGVTMPVTRNVALYGPGDVVGLDPRAIVRNEPRHWTTNVEPGYLAHVEFYDEDLPWRYTPAAPSAPDGSTPARLRPWMVLVVLAEGEFRDGKAPGKPLPFIEVEDAGKLFPPADQTWAWAHVQVNASVTPGEKITEADMAKVIPLLEKELAGTRDVAYARLVCPRRLVADTAYHAFVVPAFETGRLAGLGLDPADSPGALHPAWAAYPKRPEREPTRYPCYHRWFFRTGAGGDFESLVRQLKPRPPDARVGTRDMDVMDPDPGSILPAIDDPELGGVLKLGGALRVPAAALTAAQKKERETFEAWPQASEDYPPHPFQKRLAQFINLGDDYTRTAPGDAHAPMLITDEADDPMIVPPLYGTWHGLTRRLLKERDSSPAPHPDGWVHGLNLDPRHRVAAGFGTRVVQANQERYMDAAWEQVGDVLEANRRIRLAQLAMETSWSWYAATLLPLQAAAPERVLFLTAPLHRRVMLDGFTLHHLRATSRLQAAYTSVALRRLLAPRGRLMRLTPLPAGVTPWSLLKSVNDGIATAAPPRQTPAVTTVDEIADRVAGTVPAWARAWLRRHPWIVYLPLILALLLVLLILLFFRGTAGYAVAVALVILLVWLHRLLWGWRRALGVTDAIREEARRPEAVDALPRIPDFTIVPVGPGSQGGWRPGTTDSAEGVRFKTALREGFALQQAAAQAGRREPLRPLDLPRAVAAAADAVNPRVVVPRRTWSVVTLPPHIKLEVGEKFVEAMHYPVIDEPMYKPLEKVSSELFCPNLKLVEPDSITLLETNQRFIEAYMVGLNHELARELLWREYPTDQRGSYFRQFWDVSAYIRPKEASDPDARDRLYDIPRLHRWPRASALGDHDHRERAGSKEDEVVLVIRGELLKHYPTAVIYAHRAAWDKTGSTINKLNPRDLDDPGAADLQNPPREKVRTPLYQAKVEPDIYFFGFDLTADEARGLTADDPGWFFIIKERPGEPRFGLDDKPAGDLETWNDLSWGAVPVKDGYLSVTGSMTPLGLEPPDADDAPKTAQHNDDKQVAWTGSMTSADLAYILFQAPVMVAVHATEMLPKK